MKVEINPITRIEGHAKLSIVLDPKRKVKNAFIQATEIRGYEKLLLGLPMEEVPRIASTICGVCRAVHFIASLKASDQIFGVEPTESAKKIREAMMLAQIIEDHAVTLFALALPDFASKSGSLFEAIKNVGRELAKEILSKRRHALKVMEALGGKSMHPVSALPGGWSKRVSKKEAEEIERHSRELVTLGKRMVELVEDLFRYESPVNVDFYYVGTIKRGEVEYYDGEHAICKGEILKKFVGKGYEKYVVEESVEWSFSKVATLRGFGTHIVGPMARAKVGKFSTDLAKEYYAKYSKDYDDLMSSHFLRAIEVLYSAEKLESLSEELTGDVKPEKYRVTGEGVGIVEAPRGLLIHHYKTDKSGRVTSAKIITPTTQNMLAMNEIVRRRAIGRKFSKELVKSLEVIVRAFDPCIACATHHAFGKPTLRVEILHDGGSGDR